MLFGGSWAESARRGHVVVVVLIDRVGIQFEIDNHARDVFKHFISNVRKKKIEELSKNLNLINLTNFCENNIKLGCK